MELFDNPVSYEITANNKYHYNAKFEVEGNKYLFRAGYEDMDLWDVPEITQSFYNIEFALNTTRGLEYDIMDTGHQFTVFATVGDILQTFIREFKFPAFGFLAKEPSRKRLYDTFASRLLKMFPQYELVEFMKENNKNYMFYPKKR